MDIINDHLSQLKLSSKSGPVAPPKPTNKNHPAQIPHSNNVRQTCEPLYSKNLQNNSIPTISSSTSSPSPSLLHGKLIKQQQQQQNIQHNTLLNNVYSNMEMTLDNPAILNHQLEALEHHKKQLEMKGMLPMSSPSTSSSPAPSKFGKNIKSQIEKFQGPTPTPPPIPPSLQVSKVTPIKGTASGGSGVGMLPLQQSMTNNEQQNKMIMKNICESPKMHVYSNTSPALKSKIPPLSLQSSSSSSPLSTATQSSSASSASSSSSTTAAAVVAGLNLKRNSDVVYSNILHQQNSMNSTSSTPSQSSYSQPATHHPNQVYTNISYNSGIGELPPPPPLELIGNLSLNTSHPSSYTPDYAHQINEDDLPPPPSPVSSSYSELRRATDNFPQMPVYPLPSVYDNGGGSSISSAIDPLSGATDQQTYVNTSFQHDYSTYGPISQDSSTYESIYEPINPRPPSQLSSRSNYSLYTSYVNGIQSASPGTPLSGSTAAVTGTKVGGLSNVNGRLSSNKEAEVETLTDLLVHSMDAGCDVDSFGVCVKCGERVVGENSGCTAMKQIYHIACFTCAVCQINLQGKPFYALDGKPHCKEDYLNTLEKCSVCMKPILERILRATGKPYHPGCFTCIVCGNSLDGIPFTVDATNQNYCIEDFHKKFAPRCCVCKQPIMPEPGQEETVRVVALDRSFHYECYKCEDCGLLLSSEAEGRGCYPLDDHVLCKSCNAERVQALTNCMTTEL